MITVIAAGMPRSGSTWAFNAARMLLSLKYRHVYAAWIDDYTVTDCDVSLIKTHRADDDWLSKAEFVLCTHRDIRDVVVSLHSMGWVTIEQMIAAASAVRRFYDFWSPHSCVDLAYENIVSDRTGSVALIAHALGVHASDEQIKAVEAAIPGKAGEINHRGHDPLSLLHPGHITDGRPGRWVEQLPASIADEIWLQHADWLEAKGYAKDGSS